MVASEINGADINNPPLINDVINPPLIYDVRITSVGPQSVTGNYTYEPTNMDLAMKLHYIRVVYFFRSQELIKGLTPPMLKESIFTWLGYYYETCGRFRRSEETRRPYIKCNDCGMSLIEAKSEKTVDEWIAMKDSSAHRVLVPDQVIGPELTFSPTTLMQMTFLGCGGIAIGLSWAHVLGDAFSLAQYMNAWAGLMLNIRPIHRPDLSKCQPRSDKFPSPIPAQDGSGPLAMKKVGPVVVWHAIGKSRGDGTEPTVVTIIKKNVETRPTSTRDGLSNSQLVGTVKLDFSVAKADPKHLAALIHDGVVDERAQIVDLEGKEDGTTDFIIYGRNLTLVNWEDVSLYGSIISESSQLFRRWHRGGRGGSSPSWTACGRY
ncbi:ECERIFERUM 26-like protein [Drosera capensis]